MKKRLINTPNGIIEERRNNGNKWLIWLVRFLIGSVWGILIVWATSLTSHVILNDNNTRAREMALEIRLNEEICKNQERIAKNQERINVAQKETLGSIESVQKNMQSKLDILNIQNTQILIAIAKLETRKSCK